jgi:phosphatidylglycerol---prolipoprotein diacylglyceryl transferase
VPTFTWNVDPVLVRIPRDGLAIAIAAIGLLTIVSAIRNKAKDGIVFGALVMGVAAAVRTFMQSPHFEVRYYSLIFVLVFVGGYALLNWQIRRGGGDTEEAGDFIVYGVLGVLAGARLGHVIFYDLDKALADPWWVFAIWTGGLASHGAVVGLITAMYLFCKRRGVPFLEGSDRFAFSAALGATLVRIGNLFNSEIVGRRTDQTWGARFPRFDKVEDPPLRYPTQIYEVAIGIFVLICLYFFDRALGREKRPRGALISLFFALYFPLRFLVEFWKEHQVFQTETLDMGHYLSIPGALLGIYGLYWSFKNRLPAGWTPEARGEEYDQDEDYDDQEEREEDDEDEREPAEDDEDLDEGERDEDERDEDEDEARDEEGAEDDEPPPRKRTKKKRQKIARDPDVDAVLEEAAARRPGAQAAEPAAKKKKKKKKKKRATSD